VFYLILNQWYNIHLIAILYSKYQSLKINKKVFYSLINPKYLSFGRMLRQYELYSLSYWNGRTLPDILGI